MAKDNATAAERSWLRVLKTLEMRFDVFVEERPGPQSMIDVVRGTLANVVKLRRTTSKLGDSAYWVTIVGEG
jgi:hypothetical protein